jgi:hypothetical protein
MISMEKLCTQKSRKEIMWVCLKSCVNGNNEYILYDINSSKKAV